MAMNKQRRTANLNNIVTYDTLKNVTLLADLTIEGLTGAGFVKADANGLLSVDTGAYLPMPSQTGNAGKFLSTDGSALSWQSVPQDINIYNNDGTLTGNRTLSTGAYKLAVQWNSAFSGNFSTPTTNIFQVKSSTDENAISVWSNGGVGIGRNGGAASAVNGYALVVDNGNNTGVYAGRLYSVTTVSALAGNIVLGEFGAKQVSINDGASTGYMSYDVTNGLVLSSGFYASTKYNTTLQVNGGLGLRIFGPTGNIVVGGSTFADAGFKLDVQGTGRFTDTITGRTTDGTGLSLFSGAVTITALGGGRAINIVNGGINYTGGYNFFITGTAATAALFSGDGLTTYLGNGAGYALQLNYNTVDTYTIKRGINAGHIPMYFDITSSDYTASAYGAIPSPHIRLYSGDNTGTGGGGYGNLILQHNGSVKRGNVLIGTSTNITSAILNISSTTQGFLAPRMTNAQRTAISTPATGLMAYSTDATEGMYLNLSGGWQRLLTSGDTIANIYNSDGTLTGNRTLTANGNSLTFLGGVEEIAGGQIGLRLQGSSTTKNIWLSLKNTNASGKDYIFYSQTNGRLSIGQWNGTVSTNVLDTDNTFTQLTANGVSFLFGREANLVSGLWIGVAAGSQTLANSTLLKNGNETILSSSSQIRFYNGSTDVGRIYTTTGNFVIQTGGTFTDAGYKLDVQGTGRYTGDLSIPTGKIIIGSNTNGINLALDNDTSYPTNQNIKIGNIGSTSSSLRNVTIANTGAVPVALTGSENTLLGTSLGFDTTASGMVIIAHNAQGFSGSSIKSNSIVITGSFYQYVQSIQNSIIMGSSGYTATYIGKDYLSKTQINNAIALRASAFDNSFTAGVAGGQIKDVAFGQGLYERYFDFTSASYTIHGTTPIGVNNVNGANITIAGGRATGNAFGGDVVLSTSTAGASGSTIQTLTERMRVMNQNGYVRISTGLGFGQISDASQPTVVGSNTGGTLPDGTYLYRIAAVDALGGVTLPGGENGVAFTGTAGTNSVQITWPAMTGAVSYRIYRRLSYVGDPNGYFTSSTNSFTDTGSAITTAPYPYNNNTVRYYINSSGGGLLGAMTFASDITVNGLTIGRGNNQDQTNTAIGINALKVSTAINNTALGYASLQLNTTGAGNTALGRAAGANNISGSNNTYVGLNSGIYATSGSNTLIGCVSGSNLTTGGGNTFIGYNSGFDITTGSQNTIIGVFPYAGAVSSSTSNNIILADGIGNIRIRAFDTGNVIINGSTDAGYKLDVQGTGRFTGLLYADSYLHAGGLNQMRIGASGGERSIYSSSDFYVYAGATQVAQFRSTQIQIKSKILIQNTINGVDRISISNGSTLAIPSVSYANEIIGYQGGGDTQNAFIIRASDNTYSQNVKHNIYIYGGQNTTFSNYGDIILQHDGTNIRGNVAIGATNPQRLLHIHTTTADSHLQISGSAPSVSMTDAVTGSIYQAKFGLATSANQFATGSAAGDFVISNQAGNTIWAYNSVEGMRFTINRNLLLGGTSDSGKKLQVTGEVNVTSGNATSIEISNTAGNYHLLMSSVSVAASYGVYIDSTDLMITKTGFGAKNIRLKSSGGDVEFGNTIKTAAPTGGTSQAWKLGQYNATAPSATGYVEVEVNGVLYKLLAST